MPQMAPMNWLLLYFFFLLIFLMFNIMNYYYYLNYKNKNLMNKKMIQKNWKW
uniref:ATP synthase complex subunit 8 n=1 Tax=Rybaxis sp. 1 EF-2015 TaxID=1756864 RepID=A0A0S2M842_9COLE|nr:ATP synthase F0 subunit 8 [Rybaxis sp. 1 EF-2015]